MTKDAILSFAIYVSGHAGAPDFTKGEKGDLLWGFSDL